MTSNLLRHPKSRYSEWEGPDLDREEEKRAADMTLALLDELDGVYARTKLTDAPLHWIRDLGAMTSDMRRFLFNTLGVGEVRITLHGGQAVVTETKIPGLWRLQIGAQESLVAALLPRCVDVLLDNGLDHIPLPEHKPEGLFVAIPLLTEIEDSIKHTDLSSITGEIVKQIDMVRQPMTPADKTFILTTLGEGPVSIELMGFADSRIFSTKVKGVWRTVILSPTGKTLLHSLSVARIPPEVPASVEDLDDATAKIAEIREWLEHDLQSGHLG